ncbi:hypothetical protein SAMN05421663_103208 [Terribacillus halophilus]|uniref:Hook-length control protein FliK n=1 Tax=Terribacillus halophilus TaxID=361279 RepID=A0A1G6N7G2_9BACI|nr:hypothetical protein [Terribacillus halophilus]SDC63641.1 hypothetical protein SAMN05421663_103208 [Terribacillus halophilus]
MHHLSIQGSIGLPPAIHPQQEKRFQLGEIVTGRINKFFPDNKALLQIGAKQVIAELQTALSAGGTYWFEVKEGGERPLLQVLPHVSGKQASVSQLIELAGNKPNKTNTSFVEGLLKQQTSFTMPQLKQALILLQQTDLQPLEARKDALQLIMNRQLPVTENVLQAIAARQTQDMTATLNQLTNNLTAESDSATPLKQILAKLSPDGPAVNEQHLIQRITQEAKMGKQDLYLAIRPSFSTSAPSFDAWQKEWLAFERQWTDTGNIHPQSVTESGKLPTRTAVTLPYAALLDTFMGELQGVGKYTAASQDSLQTTLGTVRQLLSMFPERALPEHIAGNLRNSLETLQSVPLVRDMHSQLLKGSIDNEQLLVKTTELLQMLQASSKNEQSKDGAFFKQMMQDIFRQVGYSFEHDIKEANTAELPLKGLLLQHAAHGAEKAELPAQLLQQITGSQLLQVHDEKQMAYIQLQLPGAPFGFDKDLLMELEGRKEDNGKISSDHCRILFYLHLPILNDMVVDMYIQKKAVNLHIYTETEKTEQVMRPLQHKLKSALEASGYHLSSIKYTVSAEAKESNHISTGLVADLSEQKGVDYRI